MKWCMTTLALTLTVVLGCQTVSSRGGGVSKDEGFKVAVPGLGTTVKQGEKKTITVALERGANFKRDVKLEIKPTKGIRVDPTTALIKASDKAELQVYIEAAKDAALGEYRVYVKGTPTTGEPAETDFKVKVVTP